MNTTHTRWVWQWNRSQLTALLALSLLLATCTIGALPTRCVLPAGLQDRGRTHWELINPNTASWTSLQRLPGVGPVLASEIIAHRRDGNHFTTILDLDDVRGIGEVRMRRMEPYLRFDSTDEDRP
jgi:competence ComEA-like helix-hairpin-helix protein